MRRYGRRTRPGALMRAYAMAVQAPAGPVFLSIPMDDFDKPCGSASPVRKIQGRIGGRPGDARPGHRSVEDGPRRPP